MLPKVLVAATFLAILTGCRNELPDRPSLALDSRGLAVVSLGREPESFMVELQPGEVLVAVAEQEMVDVGWRLTEPTGKSWEIDLPLGRDGKEVLCHKASVKGRHRLELLRTEAGARAAVPIEVRKSSNAMDRLCATAVSAWFAGLETGHPDRTDILEKATLAALQAARPVLASAAAFELAAIAFRTDNREDGIAQLKRAAALARSGGPKLEARVKARVGKKLVGVVSDDEARAWLEAVFDLAERIGDPVSAARASDRLGSIARKRSQAPLAARYFTRALERWDSRYPVARAWTLTRLAAVRSLESRLGAARELLEEALEITPPDALRVRCEVWLQLGWVHYLAKDSASALEVYEKGEELCAEDARHRLAFLDRMATVERQRGNFEVAESYYLTALEITEQPDWTAQISTNLGALYLSTRQLQESRQWLKKAVAGFRDRNPNALAHALTLLGRVEGLAGNLKDSVARLKEAQESADALWLDAYAAGDLARSTSLVQDIDHHFVEWTMALAAATGDSTWTRQAFRRSDFARARNLVAVLGGSTKAGPPLPSDLDSVLANWPAGVLLLSYVLGDEKSHVFVMDECGLASFPLAGREILEARAEHWLAALQALPVRSAARQRDALGQVLAKALLDPVRERADSAGRWVVVADGILGRLPFAALPDTSGEPLLQRFEIVQGPSISALGSLANRRFKPARPPRLVIIADPVYAAYDQRCENCLSSPMADAEWATDERNEPPDRLPGAGQEGAQLAAMVPGSARLLAGVEASRRAVLDGGLESATTVHFAAHSVIDERRPSSSGVELSRFNAEGQPVSGLLTLDEIEDLDLEADLVVLSACQTVWGEGIRGDGLLGFAQAFLLAGASSVIVSLWDIEDQPTAELMIELYRHLLRDGDPPARALREAQAAIRLRPGLQSPAFWAGWQVIEDWR